MKKSLAGIEPAFIIGLEDRGTSVIPQGQRAECGTRTHGVYIPVYKTGPIASMGTRQKGDRPNSNRHKPDSQSGALSSYATTTIKAPDEEFLIRGYIYILIEYRFFDCFGGNIAGNSFITS